MDSALLGGLGASGGLSSDTVAGSITDVSLSARVTIVTGGVGGVVGDDTDSIAAADEGLALSYGGRGTGLGNGHASTQAIASSGGGTEIGGSTGSVSGLVRKVTISAEGVTRSWVLALVGGGAGGSGAVADSVVAEGVGNTEVARAARGGVGGVGLSAADTGLGITSTSYETLRADGANGWGTGDTLSRGAVVTVGAGVSIVTADRGKGACGALSSGGAAGTLVALVTASGVRRGDTLSGRADLAGDTLVGGAGRTVEPIGQRSGVDAQTVGGVARSAAAGRRGAGSTDDRGSHADSSGADLVGVTEIGSGAAGAVVLVGYDESNFGVAGDSLALGDSSSESLGSGDVTSSLSVTSPVVAHISCVTGGLGGLG